MGRHPSRHHVEAGPGPIDPGGIGRSDHLRHTVSVSWARLRQNSPLRQSDSSNGRLLQPAARGSLPPSQPRDGPNQLPPGGDSRRAPASYHPSTRPLKTRPSIWPAASGEKRRRTAELTLFAHKMLHTGTLRWHAGNVRPARRTRARRRDKARLKPLPSRKNAFVKTGQAISELY